MGGLHTAQAVAFFPSRFIVIRLAAAAKRSRLYGPFAFVVSFKRPLPQTAITNWVWPIPRKEEGGESSQAANEWWRMLKQEEEKEEKEEEGLEKMLKKADFEEFLL